MFFTFEEGKYLTTIVISSKKYKTDNGIRVGDNLSKIENVYEDYVFEDIVAEKGSRNIIIGDSMIRFQWIQYIIRDDEIIAIICSNWSD